MLFSHPLEEFYILAIDGIGTLIVIDIDPGPVAHVLEWRAIGFLVEAGLIDDLIEEAEMDIGTSLLQTSYGRYGIVLRRQDRIGLGCREPDRRIGNVLEVFVRDQAVFKTLAGWKGSGEIARIVADQQHRHIAAI